MSGLFVGGQRSIERVCLFASWAILGSIVEICWVEICGDRVCAELIFVIKNKLPKPMRRKVKAEVYFINKLSNKNITDELFLRQYAKVYKIVAGFLLLMMIEYFLQIFRMICLTADQFSICIFRDSSAVEQEAVALLT
jgi:hypothetical protein